jgi:SAM-dependent methyltransferase
MLDIGCYDGSISCMLRDIAGYKEVYGIDFLDEFVEKSKARGVIASKVEVNQEPFPFPDNYFSFIFCGDVLEHLYNPDNMLAEIHRVSIDHGIIIFTVPNLASWANRIALLLGYQPYYADVSTKYGIGKLMRPTLINPPFGGHFRGYTHRALKKLLGVYCLRVVKVSGYEEPHMPSAVKFIDKLISKLSWLASRLIICAINEK